MLLLSCSFAPFIRALCYAAINSDLEQDLARKYENTVLILRRPVDSNTQHYNGAGDLFSPGQDSSWTVNAAVEVKKIHLTDQKLTFEGTRRVYGFDLNRKALLPLKVKDKDKVKVKVEIALDAPLTGLDQCDGVIHRIFTSDESELIGSVPDFWHAYLARQYGKPAADMPHNEPASEAVKKPLNAIPLDPKFVKAPKPLSTPDPSYSDAARHYKFEGTTVLSLVVDTSGNVVSPSIVRPAGVGLDEQAVNAVRTWKFQPALRNGEPVAVIMSVEVSFNLH